MMNYQYIEQLLESYFACQTTLQEEQILRSFFMQDESRIPEHLAPYADLFKAMLTEERLGDDFDERLLALIDEPKHVKARTIKMSDRMRPLFKAAAMVAVVLALGQALNLSLHPAHSDFDDVMGLNPAGTETAAPMAGNQKADSLQATADAFSKAERADSLRSDSLLTGL